MRSSALSTSRCCWHASQTFSTPVPFIAIVSIIGGTQRLRRSSAPPSVSIARKSATVSAAPGRSAILTTKQSAISSNPALMVCAESPRPGTVTTTTVSATFMISSSTCPTPTVSTRIMSQPNASSARITSRVAGARPPRVWRAAILRMKTPLSPAWRCMRTRSPRTAPPVNGLDGSTATMPTERPSLRMTAANESTSVLFPEPGGPVTPMTCACPVCGYRAATSCLAPASPFSIFVIALASARQSRATTRRASSRVPSLSFGAGRRAPIQSIGSRQVLNEPVGSGIIILDTQDFLDMLIASARLSVKRPFSLFSTVVSHGWYQTLPFRWDAAEEALLRAEALRDGRIMLVRIEETASTRRNHRDLVITVKGDGARDPGVASEMARRVNVMLHADEDLSGFYELSKRVPDLEAARKLGAGRCMRAPTLWEDVVKTILSTNVTWRQAVHMIHRLAELGDPCPADPSLRAWTTPGQVVRAKEKFLRDTVRAGYRAPYIMELAKAQKSGAIDLDTIDAAAKKMTEKQLFDAR